MRKLTKDEFVKVSNEKHNYKYDYSITNYINTQSKVDIICSETRFFFTISDKASYVTRLSNM